MKNKISSKIFMSVAIIFTMLIGVVGCGETADTQDADSSISYTAGTYEAAAQGYGGEVTVSVTYDENEITDIEFGDNEETPGISDAAFDEIPNKIIENQSLAVDTVSGATFTSNAILEAVEETVVLADGDVEALKAKSVKEEEVSTELIEKESDVVIIGGGGAGLAAAVEAGRNGSSVILIETNPYLGGNILRSGGGMWVSDSETAKLHPIE